MTWIKGKGLPKAPTGPEKPAHTPLPSREVQEIIANFLVTHERVELRNGHPLMHFLGMSHNHHDGSVDYAIRSHVHGIDGKKHRYDSQVRIYASGHLKLIR